MRIDNPLWRQRVIMGRSLSLILLAGTVVVGSLAYSHGLNVIAIINAVIFGVNAVMAGINWFWFEL